MLLPFEESFSQCRQHGAPWSMSILLSDLAGLRVLQGRLDEARMHATEALSHSRAIRDRRSAGVSLQMMAMLEAASGRARRVAWLYGAGQAMLDSVGAFTQVDIRQVQDRYLGPARQTLGEAAFDAAANDGQNVPAAVLMDRNSEIG